MSALAPLSPLALVLILAVGGAAFALGMLVAGRRRARSEGAMLREIERLSSGNARDPSGGAGGSRSLPPAIEAAMAELRDEWRRAREDADLRIGEAHGEGEAEALRRLAAATAGRFADPLAAAETARARAERSISGGAPEEALRALGELRRALHRAERRLIALRALSPEGKTEGSETGLEELLRLAADACRQRADAASVRVVLEPPPRSLPVRADAAMLVGALEALIDNAIAAASLGGCTVTLSAHPLPEGRVAAVVEDDGPGIPEGLIDRLFDPLFTTRPGGDGVGLGLPLALAAAKHHGGTVVLERGERGGTRARLTLPGAPAGRQAGTRSEP